MTPTLDRLFRQWVFYKRCLIAFILVNVFSVALSLVLSVQYFGFQKDTSEGVQKAVSQIQQVERAQMLIEKIQESRNARPKWDLRQQKDEAQLLALFRDWQELVSIFKTLEVASVDNAASVTGGDDSFIAMISRETSPDLKRLSVQMASIKEREWQSLSSSNLRHQSRTRTLMIVGIITLLFGLIMPGLLFVVLGRTLNRIRTEMQNAALEFIRGWAEARAGFGDDAFKSVEFWLQVLLLLGHQAGHLSSHPAVQVTSELAHLIRLELKKSAQSSSAA